MTQIWLNEDEIAVQFPGYDSKKPNWFDIVDSVGWIEEAYEQDILFNTYEIGPDLSMDEFLLGTKFAERKIILKITLPSGKYEVRPGDWIIYNKMTETISYMDPELFVKKYD